MGKIHIMRHGPTDKNDNLNENKLKYKIDEIINEINKYGKIDLIISSPIERCDETSKILITNLDYNVSYSTKKKLVRVQSDETMKECHKRGYHFAKKIKKLCKFVDINVLIISHSSLIPGLIHGITEKYEKLHLHSCSLTSYDCDKNKLINYNKKWYK